MGLDGGDAAAAAANGGRADDPDKASVSARLRTALFRTLYELARDDKTTKVWLLLLWALDFANMVFLPLATTASLAWRDMPLMANGIYVALLPFVFMPDVAVSSDILKLQYSAQSLFIVAAVFTAALVRGRGRRPAGPAGAIPLYPARIPHVRPQATLLSWSVLIHLGLIKYRPAWRVRLTRALLRIGIHGLPLPLMASLAGPFDCVAKDTWINSSLEVRQRLHRPAAADRLS